MSDTSFEKHYTIGELAKIWGMSIATVRRLVMLEPDVIRRRGPLGRKTSYRIPESVARRIHTSLITPQRRPQVVAR